MYSEAAPHLQTILTHLFLKQDNYPTPRKDLERQYRRQQLQKQAQNHGKKMTDLRNHNQTLEQQRDGMI